MNALFPTPPAVIQIDRGVPLPPSQQIFKRKYPFSTMAVGDSFFVPGMVRQRMAGPIRYASCECRKFTTRRTVENGIPGLRVWRIS
jgi:hypothetical protein